MKKILLSFFICFAFSTSAQEMSSIPDLFSFSEPLTASTSKTSKSGNKIVSRINNPMNVEVRRIDFKDLGNLASAKKFDTLSPGYLSIKIPKRKKKKGYV
ncbi:hypothetical protein [Maribacter sp. 2307ULW6-5]|uniref:hypothetical protein n=1 Tax=Maribacter sp. 2307ULW6-5 TaxID=3386275 RepID=UPI0039BD7F8D